MQANAGFLYRISGKAPRRDSYSGIIGGRKILGLVCPKGDARSYGGDMEADDRTGPDSYVYAKKYKRLPWQIRACLRAARVGRCLPLSCRNAESAVYCYTARA